MDIYSRMYPPIDEIDEFFDREHADAETLALALRRAKTTAGKPYVLCEYCSRHGQWSRGSGGLYRCFHRHADAFGAFVWEWCDHAVYVGRIRGRTAKYLYGGDFGEVSSDGNFCMDGLVLPDRRISTSLEETGQRAPAHSCLRHGAGRPGRAAAEVSWTLPTRGETLSLRWELARDGVTVAQGEAALPSMPPRETVTVALHPYRECEGRLSLRLTTFSGCRCWFPAGRMPAWTS